MRPLAILGMAAFLSACSVIPKSPAPAASEVASAMLLRGNAAVGTATLSQIGDDVMIDIKVTGLADGEYGMHLHQIGKCEGPDYKSAGPHWNPGGRQHGLNNPQGAHGGDLPNLIGANGKAAAYSGRITGIRLSGPNGLIDGDGAALIIHAKPDDGLTDPSGNSGDRMICGVLTL